MKNNLNEFYDKKILISLYNYYIYFSTYVLICIMRKEDLLFRLIYKIELRKIISQYCQKKEKERKYNFEVFMLFKLSFAFEKLGASIFHY